jgi:hypothetical protein
MRFDDSTGTCQERRARLKSISLENAQGYEANIQMEFWNSLVRDTDVAMVGFRRLNADTDCYKGFDEGDVVYNHG